MTEFEVGDIVRITKRFGSDEGDLWWMPAMDKFVGTTAKVERVDEVGDVLLDCGWYFYPRVLEHVNKSPAAKILFEKILVNGVKCRRITGFEGILGRDALPKTYIEGRPAFWHEDCARIGAHVFNGKQMGWQHPDGSRDMLHIGLPAGANIDVGSYIFSGMNVGDVWPEATYQELLTWIKRAGSRLAKIRQQEREAWSGGGADEI